MIERSKCEECLYHNICMEIPISQSTYPFICSFEIRRNVHYSDHAREVLAIIVDCTKGSAFLEYAKSIIIPILQHYHEQADVRTFLAIQLIVVLFTSGDRLGVYNIKHSLTKVLVLVDLSFHVVHAIDFIYKRLLPLFADSHFDSSSICDEL